ncbi:precorrin-3B synthase [Symbioplanes lichenis]|uniref:precorrin-3B synthase n=1 Tax=Symbioplanes lichenis TaxID=1629072 RepID=UPI00273897AA|nr:precorrin-3B synthase [Actinoplanes lichenis]
MTSATERPHRRPADGCPSVTRRHEAMDGGLVRVHVPGGLLRLSQFGVLRTVATRYGTGDLELTSRANVQIRGLAPGAELDIAPRISAAGLLPSARHDHARNIVVPPGSSFLLQRVPRLRRLVAELDRAICADAELAALPGRFLFAVGDGSGGRALADADVALRPVSANLSALLLAGEDCGLVVGDEQAVPAMVAAARCFLAENRETGGDAWRIKHLAKGPAAVAGRLLRSGTHVRRAQAYDPPPSDAPEAPDTDAAGLIAQPDGSVTMAAVVPFGRLRPEQSAVLTSAAVAGEGVLTVTTRRSVVIRDVPARIGRELLGDFVAAGLIVDPRSPLRRLTTCVGRPACGKALRDVRADATRTAAVLAGSGPPVHWSGCERRCGRPSVPHAGVVATSSGYVLELGGRPPVHGGQADVVAMVAAARRGREREHAGVEEER